MRSILLFFCLSISLISCKDDDCNMEIPIPDNNVRVFKDSTVQIVTNIFVQPQLNYCAPEVVQDPEHGTVEVIDSIGFNYTPDEGFFGIDEFTYINHACGELVAKIKVWESVDNFCLDNFNALPDCISSKFNSSPSTIRSSRGISMIDESCNNYIESVDILKEPELGTVEFDRAFLKYSYSNVSGNDIVELRVCVNINDQITCKDIVWNIELTQN